MRRHLLGLIALASLLSAAIIHLFLPLAPYQAAGDVGLRFGLVLGAFWLAWPDLHHLPRWVWYAAPIGFIVLIYAKGVLVFLVPAFAVAGILYLLFRGRKGRSR